MFANPRWSDDNRCYPFGLADGHGRGPPRFESTNDVGRVGETELLETCGSQAGAVALFADDDYEIVQVGSGWVPGWRSGIQTPLEHVQRDLDGVGQPAIASSVVGGADIDQDAAAGDEAAVGPLGGQSDQAVAGLAQHVVDRDSCHGGFLTFWTQEVPQPGGGNGDGALVTSGMIAPCADDTGSSHVHRRPPEDLVDVPVVVHVWPASGLRLAERLAVTPRAVPVRLVGRRGVVRG